MKRLSLLSPIAWALCSALAPPLSAADGHGGRPNVLFIIADDLTATALSCYGNTTCRTPNIDRLAARGTRFTRAFCNATYCGPSRASMLSGYYPHATGVLGYTSPRPAIGGRATWPQHFKDAGYYTARVSKIYHMGVPGGIEDGRPMARMIRRRGPSGSTAPARNGRRRGPARRWKGIPTGRSRSWAAIRSSWSRRTATTWPTPTGRPRRRPWN